MSSKYLPQVGDVVELHVRPFVAGDEAGWFRGTVTRKMPLGYVVTLDKGGERHCFAQETRPVRKCCVCGAVATWTTVPECKSYCEGHSREVLMVEDREDFADEFAREDRCERERAYDDAS